MPNQTTSLTTSATAPATYSAGGAQLAISDTAFDVIRQHGVLLRYRRQQTLPTTFEHEPLLYVVQKGALIVDLEILDKRRQILLLLLAGDTYDARLLPGGQQCRVQTAGPGELIRLRPTGLAAIERAAPETLAELTARTSRLLATTLFNHSSIGRLNGEERLASYLLEIGSRTGSMAAGEAAIDMPLARRDIADYLALNADTLSRIMTRLRERGAVGRALRGKLAIRSWSKLREMSPIADIIAPLRAD